MFYMEDIYGFRLSDQDQQLLTAWSRQDSPDAWEIERSRRIKAIQGRILGNGSHPCVRRISACRCESTGLELRHQDGLRPDEQL